jgi:zona occludens toxin
MITFIDGTPGAGKTLYTVEKLLLPVVGTVVKQEVDGEVIEHPRTIYTNVNGLMVDHELIDGSETGGLRNWHQWAKPGAIIVFDEVQKVWPPRPNGSKVPDDIQHLETHRHMGVDFVLISQGATLCDQNISKLAGRHLHVRRIGKMPLAIVYEWDRISRQLLFSKAFNKSPWRYDKKVFKLYKSADLHTKQPRKLPGLVWFLLAGIVAMAVLGPTFYGRMQERIGKPQASKVSTEGNKATGGPSSGPAGHSAVQASATAAPQVNEQAFAGCAAMRERCICFGADGVPVDKGPGFCTIHTRGLDQRPPIDLAGFVITEQERHRYALTAAEQDRDLLEWIVARSERSAGKLAPHADRAEPAVGSLAANR